MQSTLTLAHAKLDAAAYGFDVDLSDEQILENFVPSIWNVPQRKRNQPLRPKKRTSRARTADEMI